MGWPGCTRWTELPDYSLIPLTLGLLAHTNQPRGSVPPRDTAPTAYEASARVLEQALHQAVHDPTMLGRIGAALGRLGRDADRR